MKILDLTKFFKNKKEDEEPEVDEKVEEPPMSFDDIIKANADKKAKEAKERLNKNKQVLKDYKINPKK